MAIFVSPGLLSGVLRASKARVQAAACRERKCDDNLVGVRRVGEHRRDRVVVGANIEFVLVRQRYVYSRSRCAAFAGRRNPGFRAADQSANRIGKYCREQGVAVLILSRCADNAGLAVTENLVFTDCGPQPVAEFRTQVG